MDFEFILEKIVHELEDIRRKYVSQIIFWTFLLVALLPIAVHLYLKVYLKVDYDYEFYFIALLFMSVLLLVPYWLYSLKWKKRFKEMFIKLIVEKLFPNLSYYPDKKIEEEVYHASSLFYDYPKPDIYKGEDLLEGSVGRTNLRICELHTQYREEYTDSKGNKYTRYITIFRGLFGVADFNKKIEGLTILIDNKLIKTAPKKLQRVKLEDPEFEKHFDVYSTDQVESRYIFTPSFMEKVLKLRKNDWVKGLRLSFQGSKVYIALYTNKNLLEPPSIFKSTYPLIYEGRYRKYIEELILIQSIVEELDLNTRIWGV